MTVVSFLVLAGATPRRWSWSSTTGVQPPGPGTVEGVVAGLFVAATVATALVGWRSPTRPLAGVPTVTGGVLAAQALLVTLVALRVGPGAGVVLVAALLVVALAGLVGTVLALLRIGTAEDVTDDCFGVGLGMGLMASAYVLPQLSLIAPVPAAEQVVLGILLATQVTAVTLVLRMRVLTPATQRLLPPTVLVGALGMLVVVTGAEGTPWDLTASAARAAAGAAWLVTAWHLLQLSRVEERRRVEEMDVAVRFTRDHRERLHELRSTMAGLVNGSELLDRPEVPADAREHLWLSVRRELDRMNRLLSDQVQSPADLDLDASLDLILDLQRLKGRNVELRGSGDSVRAQYDSLAEVVNILIDNAATHGGTDSSVIEVMRRDDDTVDIEVTDFGRGIPEDQRDRIFDWGDRGAQSPGEGIGLHLARRLVNEDGGSLRLRDASHTTSATGSSFVISLPAARRSSENFVADDADTEVVGG